MHVTFIGGRASFPAPHVPFAYPAQVGMHNVNVFLMDFEGSDQPAQALVASGPIVSVTVGLTVIRVLPRAKRALGPCSGLIGRRFWPRRRDRYRR